MNKIATPLRVGIVLLIGIAGFAWYVVETADTPITGGSGYTVSVVFDNAFGLVPKSRVLIAGIAVGEIRDIDLEGGRARVYLRINDSIVLHRDAAARKIQESMLGTNLIELSPGSMNAPVLKDGDEITRVISSPGLNDMMASFGDISKDLKDITRSLRDLVDNREPDRGSLRELIDHLTRVSAVVDGQMDGSTANIELILENTRRMTADLAAISLESRKEVQLILADIRNIAESLKTVVDREGGQVNDAMGKVNGLLERLDGTLQRLDNAMANAEEVSEKVNEGKGAVSTLINDEQVAEDIKAISGAAGKYASKLDELQTWFHVQSDFYYHQLSAKTAVSLKLIPRKDKYYMISLVDDPRGKTNRYRTLTKTTDSNQDAFVREERTVTSYSFKFSLQYAQSFDFATFRFGLIENSGGLGFDMQFFDEILKIRNDFYEFSTGETYPRIRSQINVDIWRYIFLAAGVDDIANNNTRDYFFGAGIQFNDEDLKTLFSAGAGSAAGALAK